MCLALLTLGMTNNLKDSDFFNRKYKERMKVLLKPAACFCLLMIGALLLNPAARSDESGQAAVKTGLVREIWRNIEGRAVVDLTSHSSYSGAAAEKTVVAKIDDEKLGELYGSRYTGILQVPETGDYTFYIASDDSSELWLGKDDTQNDMACIAFVKGYTFKHNWESQMNQKSAPVHLEKGKKYYICVFHKQEFSVDHVSVAWSGPNIAQPTIIPPSAFSQVK